MPVCNFAPSLLVRAQHVVLDPTEGIKSFPQKTEGFHVWTEEEIAKFATPIGSLALIANADGCPINVAYFGHWFKAACKAAGVPGRAHGLRKACATRFAEHGATEEELKAWFAWADGRMASVYTRKANRGKLAIEAARKLGR